jgi:hypothetical protein
MGARIGNFIMRSFLKGRWGWPAEVSLKCGDDAAIFNPVYGWHIAYRPGNGKETRILRLTAHEVLIAAGARS